jgi:hypothetical protein
MRKLSFIFLFLLLATAGCNNSENSAGSCNTGVGVCYDWTGSGYTASDVEAGCGGMYSSSPCTSENLVGSCIILEGTISEYITRYYAPTYTAADAQFACTALGGTWVPE